MEDQRAERTRSEPRTGKVNRLKTAAADEVRSRVEAGAGAAAGTLGDMADALRKAGDELAGRERSGAADLAQAAARGLTDFAQALTSRSADDLVEDVRRFGRTNPTAFIGLSLLAGFAIGRLLTSSPEEEEEGIELRPNGFSEPAPAWEH